MTKDQILAALPNLGHEDLQAIRAACMALTGPVAYTTQQGAIAWLGEALGAFIGGNYLSPRHVASKAFVKNAPIAIKFLDKHFTKVMMTKVPAMAVMRYMLNLLSDDLKAMKVPVNRTTLSQNLHRLEEVFNNAFPGYSTDGKAAMLIVAALIPKK